VCVEMDEKIVKVEKPTSEDLKKLNLDEWGIWEKEISKFDWYYDTNETCYFLEGKVVVTTEDGQKYEVGKGDLVTFPKGLKCVWEVIEPVKKRYKFF